MADGDARRTASARNGEYLWQLAHGIDDRPVVPEREAKSISHETTFEEDIDDLEVLRAWLVDLTEQVGWRLRRHGLRGRTVHLKVRFADFSTITRSQTLPEPTDITHELWQAADEMLCHRLPAGHLPVRLMGMGVSGFDETGRGQGLLFDQDQRKKQAGLGCGDRPDPGAVRLLGIASGGIASAPEGASAMMPVATNRHCRNQVQGAYRVAEHQLAKRRVA